MDLAILERWVNINSGSLNPAGLKAMADTLEESLSRIPGKLERIPLPACVLEDGTPHQPGDVLRLRFRPEAPVRVLMNGHMDTVFGPDHPFQRLIRLPDGRIRGPGVADMKGGLFILIEAVRRFLDEDQYGNVGGEILITADEEIGSGGSHSLLLEAAGWNHLGLVFESAMPGGELVRCRKGTGTFHITAHGKAAHTGRDFQNGRNAIVALASLAVDCHALNEEIPDAIVNVGTFRGGGTVNVVPDRADSWLNIRIGEADTAGRIGLALHSIIAHTENRFAGIKLELEGGFARAPKEETPGNAALHQLWNEVEKGLGFAASGKRDTGGSSDGNILGGAGLPHLDGVGVRGGSIHSEGEFALPDSIAEQVAKTTGFLHRLSRNPEIVDTPPIRKEQA